MDAALRWVGGHIATAGGSVILPSAMADRDAQAIREVLDGDVDRFAELVNRYQDRALQLAFSLTGNHDDAKDLSQEAFIRAYRSLDHFRGRAQFSTWLYRILVNVCKDAMRSRLRRPRVVAGVGEPDPNGADEPSLFVVDAADPGGGPSAHAANQELAQQLAAAIRALPEQQRLAFLLHHVHGLSLEEAAAVMRCRLGTVKSHLFRATSHLQAQLAPWRAQEGL